MIWSSLHFQNMFLYPLPFFCETPVVLRDGIIFVQKQYFCLKMQIIIIMCSDNVFTIIVWYFIKIAEKRQKFQLVYSIYLNEK